MNEVLTNEERVALRAISESLNGVTTSTFGDLEVTEEEDEAFGVLAAQLATQSKRLSP